MRECEYCDRTEETHHITKSKEFGMICGRCNQRKTRGDNTVYEIPEYGEVTYNHEGKPICHICGKAYNKVLSHAYHIHEIRAREYKEEFGLDVIKGIMSEESTELASKRNEENRELVVKENLVKKGKETRFEIGNKGRTKDQVSEQTRRRLAEQGALNLLKLHAERRI